MTARLLFVTGTDTGVGKTYISCSVARLLQARGTSVGIYKPVCSGAETDDAGNLFWADVEDAFEALGGQFPRELICPQTFEAPLAPPIAAAVEDRAVSAEQIVSGLAAWREQCEILLIEGAGGLLCPLTAETTFADFAGEHRLPMLIVARLGLGAINHTLLTCEVARQRGLEISGVVLNQGEETVDEQLAETNHETIARFLTLSARQEPRPPVPMTIVHRDGEVTGNFVDETINGDPQTEQSRSVSPW